MFLQYSKIYQRCFTKVAEHGDFVILQNKFIKYISLRLNSTCVILTIVIILNIFTFLKCHFVFWFWHMPRIVTLEIAHWNVCLFTTYLSYKYKDKKILVYMVTPPPNRNKKVRWKIAYQFVNLIDCCFL